MEQRDTDHQQEGRSAPGATPLALPSRSLHHSVVVAFVGLLAISGIRGCAASAMDGRKIVFHSCAEKIISDAARLFRLVPDWSRA